MDFPDVGERIAMLRTAKGVNASEMSRAIGKSDNFINKIENKKSKPSMDALYDICKFFNITPKEFFDDGADEPELLREMILDYKRLPPGEQHQIAGLAKTLATKGLR